jgi:hypothetical protein
MNQAVWHIEWNDEMSVGIPEIDADEKHFIVPVAGSQG